MRVSYFIDPPHTMYKAGGGFYEITETRFMFGADLHNSIGFLYIFFGRYR